LTQSGHAKVLFPRRVCEPRHGTLLLGMPNLCYNIFCWSVGEEVLMYPRRLTAFSAVLIFAMFLACSTSAQTTDRMKATAMEKMMPADKVAKMRDCEKQAAEHKIKIEDRSRFVNECVWGKAK